jgi:hypothetical protein
MVFCQSGIRHGAAPPDSRPTHQTQSTPSPPADWKPQSQPGIAVTLSLPRERILTAQGSAGTEAKIPLMCQPPPFDFRPCFRGNAAPGLLDTNVREGSRGARQKAPRSERLTRKQAACGWQASAWQASNSRSLESPSRVGTSPLTRGCRAPVCEQPGDNRPGTGTPFFTTSFSISGRPSRTGETAGSRVV